MYKSDLITAINLMSNKWVKQSNVLDRKTSFIYDIEDFESFSRVSNLLLSKSEDVDYALHRWVNLQISNYCEALFCKYGAIKVENKKDKEKDIFIDNVPFDVKVTNYPNTAYEKFDLKNIEDKNNLAIWFYNNQSQEGRKHLKNRLFVVCNGKDNDEKWKNRINLDLLENKIKNFMNNKEFVKLDLLDAIYGMVVIE